MKKQFIHGIIVLLSISILSVSCRSRTMIYASPTAKVYNKKGEYKGETPYMHSDLKLTGMGTKFKLEADGHETLDIKIKRLEKIKGGNIFFSLFLFFPILWVGHYDNYHAYNLQSNDKSKIVEANYLTYSEPFKTDKKGFPIYIGKENNNHFAYMSGEVIEMDSKFQKKNSYEISSSAKGYRTGPIDAFIYKNNKCVLDINPDGDILTANILSKNGQVSTKELQKISHEREMINPEVQFGYNRPIEGDEFIAYNKEKLYHYNLDFQLIDEYPITGTLIEAKLTNSGVIVSLESDGKSIYISKRGLIEDKHVIEFTNSRGLSNIRLNVNEELNRIFVSYLLSPEMGNSSKKNSKDPDVYSNGVQLISYELSSFKQLDSETINFNDDVINKGAFPSEKKNSIKFLVNRGVMANKSNVYINLEEQWITIITSDNSSKSVLNARGIITINAAQKDFPMAFIQKNGLTTFEYERLSYNQIIKGDKIHYLFNDNVGFAKPVVQQIIFDSNMNRLSQDVYDINKEQKTALNTARTYPLEGGQRLIFHARKNKLGAGVINFE